MAAGERVLHCPTLRPEGARPQPFPAPRPPWAARGTARTAPEQGSNPASCCPPSEVGPGGGARSRVSILLSWAALAGPRDDPSCTGHGRPCAPGPISGAVTDMQMRRRLLRECRSQGLVGSRWGSEPGQSGGCVARGGGGRRGRRPCSPPSFAPGRALTGGPGRAAGKCRRSPLPPASSGVGRTPGAQRDSKHCSTGGDWRGRVW